MLCFDLLDCVLKNSTFDFLAFFIAIGIYMEIIEFFLMITFKVNFDGWSLYPMIPLVLIGLGMIAISISRNAKEILARKLHF